MLQRIPTKEELDQMVLDNQLAMIVTNEVVIGYCATDNDYLAHMDRISAAFPIYELPNELKGTSIISIVNNHGVLRTNEKPNSKAKATSKK